MKSGAGVDHTKRGEEKPALKQTSSPILVIRVHPTTQPHVSRILHEIPYSASGSLQLAQPSDSLLPLLLLFYSTASWTGMWRERGTSNSLKFVL